MFDLGIKYVYRIILPDIVMKGNELIMFLYMIHLRYSILTLTLYTVYKL